MSNPWGDDTSGDNPFGDDDYNDFDNNGGFAANNADGQYPAQQQQQKEKTTDDYLRETLGNLIETEEMGEEGLAHLAAQDETLDRISDNIVRVNNTLDVADRTLTEIEHPWAFGNVATKRSGTGFVGTGNDGGVGVEGGGAAFQMKGKVYKRGRILKNWNARYFKQVGDCIQYYNSEKEAESNKKMRGKIILTGGKLTTVAYGEKDPDGAVVDKDQCFHIQQEGQSKGDTIYCEIKRDYNTWVNVCERIMYPERFKSMKGQQYNANVPRAVTASNNRSGVGFNNEGQDQMLDQIIDKLDNIDGISRMMGSEIERSTAKIKYISEGLDHTNQRVITNTNRAQNIK